MAYLSLHSSLTLNAIAPLAIPQPSQSIGLRAIAPLVGYVVTHPTDMSSLSRSVGAIAEMDAIAAEPSNI